MTEPSTTSLTGHELSVAPPASEPGPWSFATTAGIAGLTLAIGAMLGGAMLGVTHPPPATARHAAVLVHAPLAAAAVVAPMEEAAPEEEVVVPPPRVRPTRRSEPARTPSNPSDGPLRITAPGVVTGYQDGRAMPITVTMVDNKPVERHTALAFQRMQDRAHHDGVLLRIISAFRTMEHQRALFADYRAGRGNLAAVPGHSNHQSGHALDLNVTAPGVRAWLESHAHDFGFRRTVPSESWHWEHW